MAKKEKIIELVFDSVDENNQQLPEERQLKKLTGAVLFGASGGLDSLGLVNLIVDVEQKIEDAFGVTINLADEKAISQKNSPFATIETLAAYISLLLEGSENVKK